MIKKYEIKNHAIYQGDAIEVLRDKIANNSIDLIFADPPYNIGKRFDGFDDKWPSDEAYAEWCEKWLTLCIDKLSSQGSMYVMTSTQAMPYIDIILRKRINILSRIIWSYDSSGVQAKKYYGSMYEPILFCVKDLDNYTFNADTIAIEAKTGAKRKLIDYRKKIPTIYNTKKVPGNVWYFPRVRYKMDEYEDHPSQKPETLLQRIVQASSNKEDIILDPFAGAFTTNAVARTLGRKSIGIERSQKHVEIGLRRVLGYLEHNGQPLRKPVKNTKQRNANGVKNCIQGDIQEALFSGER